MASSAPAGPAPPGGAAAAGRDCGREARVRELRLPLFGEERSLGQLPTRLHSDLRHFVEMLRRGKQPRLAQERLTVLEQALAEPGSEVKSLGELRARVEEWRAHGRRTFDADRYYDGARTSGYTEHNRGSQEALARRALQLSSLATTADGDGSVGSGDRPEGLLVIDLGCGSGLSTAVATNLRGHSLGVIGVDLSSEMLRADMWAEVSAAAAPIAGERVRCDLAQPLPFRAGTFDLAYSVGAVHYLAQDSERRTASARLEALTSSLRHCLSAHARPCTLQAFLSREPAAVPAFERAAGAAGWPLCDLVVDKTYGAKGAEREFLYLLPREPPGAGPGRPARCPLYRHCGATCALALEAWASARGAPPVRLDAAHRAWLEREHERYARRVLRLRGRGQGEEGPLMAELAERLAPLLGGPEEAQTGPAPCAAGGEPAEPRAEVSVSRIVEVLHAG